MKQNKRITIGGNIPAVGQKAPNTIVLRQPRRFNIDIADFMTAIQAAENVDFPMRYRLYDLYSDILMDTHLFSVIDRRMSSVAAADISCVRNGIPDEAIGEQIDSPWFISLVRDILDSRFWGFSLLQFYKKDGWIDYDLIPRKHVDPVKRLILHRQTDITGVSWDEYDNLLPVGRRDDLGLLARAAPWVIYKRNDVADWAQFAEIFGTPIREYIYETDDDDARRRAIADAAEEGSLAAFIHAKDTELHLVESGNKSGSSDLYDKFCQRCNNEISKLILGNTLTTESQTHGTQSLGTVHKKEEEKLLRDDQKYILNVLNYDMTDIFQAMGIDTKGGRFVFVDPKYTDLQSKITILTQLKSSFGLPIDDDYLYNEFGIDKPKNYSQVKGKGQIEKTGAEKKKNANELTEKHKNGQEGNDTGRLPEGEKREKKDKKGSARLRTFADALRRFFVRAPRDGAPLGW